ncbi:hypothetical protein SSP531S_54350 [Streptomyces spongiicola]|uniref:Uncharacterized protein n=1 Tax=Streptomyces spongiicola TaxID=1690221 RepID=A0A388T6U4_9ACTN|nr:hypothetical protein [Streptomyces spongiicola]GBQ03954.1 hypothetical protein SSP531S_54350 [Streptomyces spongiicola]
MAAPREYSEELRERATRLAVEARKDPADRTGAIRRTTRRPSAPIHLSEAVPAAAPQQPHVRQR